MLRGPADAQIVLLDQERNSNREALGHMRRKGLKTGAPMIPLPVAEHRRAQRLDELRRLSLPQAAP